MFEIVVVIDVVFMVVAVVVGMVNDWGSNGRCRHGRDGLGRCRRGRRRGVDPSSEFPLHAVSLKLWEGADLRLFRFVMGGGPHTCSTGATPRPGPGSETPLKQNTRASGREPPKQNPERGRFGKQPPLAAGDSKSRRPHSMLSETEAAVVARDPALASKAAAATTAAVLICIGSKPDQGIAPAPAARAEWVLATQCHCNDTVASTTATTAAPAGTTAATIIGHSSERQQQ
jgi:hypothetical protein